jgi:hypothetical protein
MTWKSHLLCNDDDLELSRTGACVTNGVAIVEWTGTGTKTPADVANALASQDSTNLKLRIKNGRSVDAYVGSAWVDTNPSMVGGGSNKNDGTFKARDITIERVDDGGQIFRVEYTCSAYGPIADNSDYPLTEPSVQVTTTARTRNVPIFRTGAHVPADFLPADTLVTDSTTLFDVNNWKTGDDISDASTITNRVPFMVDIDKQGLPGKINQTVIDITWVNAFLNYSWTTTGGATRDDVGDGGTFDLTGLTDYWVGCRNSEVFLGFPIGSLMVEAVSVQPLDEYDYRRVSVTLVYDEWHHAFQSPLTIEGICPGWEDEVGTGQNHALTVLWHQPYLKAAPLATGYVTDGGNTYTLLPGYVLNYANDLFGVS